ELGFAGCTRLPKPPPGRGPGAMKAHHPCQGLEAASWSWVKRVLALGVHMSGVLFFWDAASTLGLPKVPWSVTANMALANTPRRFDLRFPKTGGGEDVDLCF
ncbi:glyco_trans_2-like domain-containing protein, partial [Haematococcus lacustris]